MATNEFEDFREFWDHVFADYGSENTFEAFIYTGGTSTGGVGGTMTGGPGGTTTRTYDPLFAYDAWLGKPVALICKTLPQVSTRNLMLKTMNLQIERVKSKKQYSIPDWFQLLVLAHACKQSYFEEYNQFLQETEQMFYSSEDSCDPLDFVNKPIQLYLHLIRAHQRAESGEFDRAQRILEDLADNWIDIENSKQTNILCHYFVHLICTGQWARSDEVMNRAWSIIRLMDNSNRHNWGAWDDWVIMLMCRWFFSQYSNEYAMHLAVHTGVEMTSIVGHKKCLLLGNCDAETVKRFVPKYYYEKARTIMPNLPPWSETPPDKIF